MAQQWTRRDFLGKTAQAGLGLALPTLLPARVWSAETALNERINLGFIGVGGMGTGHLKGLVGNSQVQVRAVCDVFEPHRTRAKGIVDERYGNTDCAAYNDYRDLLARGDIDAVVISTPDHWHTLTSIHACQAGKDVYCEKPLTLTIGEGRELVHAVRRYGRVLQVGSQQRSDENFRFACELVRSGRIGKVHTVRTGFGYGPQGGSGVDQDPPPHLDWDLWLGPAPYVPFNPDRHPSNFRWFYDYSGGKMTDWGAHHNDIAQWGLGMDGSGPVEIEGQGRFPTEGNYDTAIWFHIEYTYANGVKLICGEGHGVRFEGTEGWVHVDRGFLEADPPELLQEKLGPEDVHLYESPGHHQDWLNCLRTRQSPICDVEIGHRSATVCHLGNIAIRLGRKLHWDPQREQFIDDEGANRWRNKPYRAPWHL